jgi:hypothetical protein
MSRIKYTPELSRRSDGAFRYSRNVSVFRKSIRRLSGNLFFWKVVLPVFLAPKRRRIDRAADQYRESDESSLRNFLLISTTRGRCIPDYSVCQDGKLLSPELPEPFVNVLVQSARLNQPQEQAREISGCPQLIGAAHAAPSCLFNLPTDYGVATQTSAVDVDS